MCTGESAGKGLRMALGRARTRLSTSMRTTRAAEAGYLAGSQRCLRSTSVDLFVPNKESGQAGDTGNALTSGFITGHHIESHRNTGS